MITRIITATYYGRYRRQQEPRLAEGIIDLAKRGAELIVLQELHNTLYFCQVEDVDNFDLAEPIPGPSTDFYGKLGQGSRRRHRHLPLRAPCSGALPQYGGSDGEGRKHSRKIPQDAHPRRPCLLREVLLHPWRPRIPALYRLPWASSACWFAGTSGIRKQPD